MTGDLTASRATTRKHMAARLPKYLVATVLGATANTGIYSGMVAFAGLSAAIANVAAAALVIMPRFALYKYWVWATPGRTKSGHQIRVHLGLFVLGVALSTAVVWMLERADASVPVLAVGQLSSYATIWVVRFFVLNQVFLSSHVART